MTTQSKAIFTAAVGILFAVGPFTVQAEDQVKSGATSDRPARAVDADSVKSQGASDKAGRRLEEDTQVKAPNKKRYSRQANEPSNTGTTAKSPKEVKSPKQKEQGRKLDGERSALPRTGRPGNEIDDGSVKSQGASDKAGREAEKPGN